MINNQGIHTHKHHYHIYVYKISYQDHCYGKKSKWTTTPKSASQSSTATIQWKFSAWGLIMKNDFSVIQNYLMMMIQRKEEVLKRFYFFFFYYSLKTYKIYTKILIKYFVKIYIIICKVLKYIYYPCQTKTFSQFGFVLFFVFLYFLLFLLYIPI